MSLTRNVVIGTGAYGTPYHSPDEVRAFQSQVGSKSMVVDRAVRSCAALDDATRAGWGAFYIVCQDYSKREVPSFYSAFELRAMWEEGLALRGQIDLWGSKLEAAGCSSGIVEQPEQHGLFGRNPANTLAAVGGVITALAVAAGVIILAPKLAALIPEKKKAAAA